MLKRKGDARGDHLTRGGNQRNQRHPPLRHGARHSSTGFSSNCGKECSAVASGLQWIYLRLPNFPGTIVAPLGRHHNSGVPLDDSNERTSGCRPFEALHSSNMKNSFHALKSTLKSRNKIDCAEFLFTIPNQPDRRANWKTRDRGNEGPSDNFSNVRFGGHPAIVSDEPRPPSFPHPCHPERSPRRRTQ